jgi:effector-binding domain-containing protein
MAGTSAYPLEVRMLPKQIVGTIRDRVPVSDLDPWIAAAIHELFARLAQQRIHPADEPFAIVSPPSGSETVDVEVALPAIRRVASRGRVTSRVLPACHALATVHRGPYERLPAAYEALAAGMKEEGIEPLGDPREVYLTNPEETSPEKYETEVLWPVDVPVGWQPSSRRVSPRVHAGGSGR